jgi:hypothetical protein
MKLSFSTSSSGLATFLEAGGFFCVLFEGGVLESSESSFPEFISTSEFSWSESGFVRFFGFAGAFGAALVVLEVAAFVALGLAAVVVFFAGAFVGALAFYFHS